MYSNKSNLGSHTCVAYRSSFAKDNQFFNPTCIEIIEFEYIIIIKSIWSYRNKSKGSVLKDEKCKFHI